MGERKEKPLYVFLSLILTRWPVLSSTLGTSMALWLLSPPWERKEVREKEGESVSEESKHVL
jgi:hypothetical protein